jgi:hypothetical protein
MNFNAIDDNIDRFLESLRQSRVCNWCKYPSRPVLKKIGLCKYCNRIRRKLNKLESQINHQKSKTGQVHPFLQHDYKLACKKAGLCKAEGMWYARIGRITQLDLERELNELSQQYVGKILFSHDASWLGSMISRRHQQFFFYILSLLNREYLRKNRSRKARWLVLNEMIDGDSS